MDIYALKLRLTAKKKIYWKIFIHGYLMFGISDDNEMSMNKAYGLLCIGIIILIGVPLVLCGCLLRHVHKVCLNACR